MVRCNYAAKWIFNSRIYERAKRKINWNCLRLSWIPAAQNYKKKTESIYDFLESNYARAVCNYANKTNLTNGSVAEIRQWLNAGMLDCWFDNNERARATRLTRVWRLYLKQIWLGLAWQLEHISAFVYTPARFPPRHGIILLVAVVIFARRQDAQPLIQRLHQQDRRRLHHNPMRISIPIRRTIVTLIIFAWLLNSMSHRRSYLMGLTGIIEGRRRRDMELVKASRKGNGNTRNDVLGAGNAGRTLRAREPKKETKANVCGLFTGGPT